MLDYMLGKTQLLIGFKMYFMLLGRLTLPDGGNLPFPKINPELIYSLRDAIMTATTAETCIIKWDLLCVA